MPTFTLVTTQNKKHGKYYTQQYTTHNQTKHNRQTYLLIIKSPYFLRLHFYIIALHVNVPIRIYTLIMHHCSVYLIITKLAPTCFILYKIR